MNNMIYKKQTFEEYLSDHCDCHTNNSPEGFENWMEQLDTEELISFADRYGKEQYIAGMDRSKEILLDGIELK